MKECSVSSNLDRSGLFHTTAWTLIRAAGSESSEARQSLEMLCRNYWSPLYVWLRRSGANVNDAEDQLQGFFAHLIEHGVLGYADPARGRFRSFLIASLKQFLAKEHHFQHAEKRRPATGIVSLDTERGEAVCRLRGSAEETAEQAFDRVWAMTVIEQASVAVLLRGLEASVTLAGVIGDDASGRTVRRLLDEAGIDAALLATDPARPTTTKERFLGRAANRHAHQILRVDTESRIPLDEELAAEWLARSRP